MATLIPPLLDWPSNAYVNQVANAITPSLRRGRPDSDCIFSLRYRLLTKARAGPGPVIIRARDIDEPLPRVPLTRVGVRTAASVAVHSADFVRCTAVAVVTVISAFVRAVVHFTLE